MKILVAEDDDAIMTTYKVMLESRKHEVQAASDGEECLTLFNKQNDKHRKEGQTSPATPFDVVILDHRMPKKTGSEVAEQILSMVPGQRIIIASAYTSELTISAGGSGHGQIEFLQKPFELDLFLDTVERAPPESAVTSGIRRATAASDHQTVPVDPNNFDLGPSGRFTLANIPGY